MYITELQYGLSERVCLDKLYVDHKMSSFLSKFILGISGLIEVETDLESSVLVKLGSRMDQSCWTVQGQIKHFTSTMNELSPLDIFKINNYKLVCGLENYKPIIMSFVFRLCFRKTIERMSSESSQLIQYSLQKRTVDQGEQKPLTNSFK